MRKKIIGLTVGDERVVGLTVGNDRVIGLSIDDRYIAGLSIDDCNCRDKQDHNTDNKDTKWA